MDRCIHKAYSMKIALTFDHLILIDNLHACTRYAIALIFSDLRLSLQLRLQLVGG